MASFRRLAGRLLRSGALTIGLLAAGTGAQAQSRFDSWSVADGLPQNSVNEILQTRDGYLWLATYGGLVRFDGVRFVVFDRGVDGVGSLRIRTMHEDRSGTLWAATDDGMLLRYREGRFTTFTSDDGLPQAIALRIDEGADGSLWVTWHNGLTRYDGSTFVNFAPGDMERGVRSHAGPAFHAGPKTLWWSRDAEGLHCLVGGRVRTCATADQLPRAEIIGVTTDRRGTLWIHTNGKGVLQITAAGRRRLLTTDDGLPDNHADGQFVEDREGRVWYAKYAGSLYCVANGRAEPVTSFLAFVTYEDREGSIWVGSSVGLHRVRRLTISQYTVRDGLSSDNVYSMLRDRRGDVWVGTWGSGLNRRVHGRFAPYRVEQGLPSNYVTGMSEDRSGRLWVGTTGGLAYFERGRFRPSTAPDGLLSGSVWDIHEDAAGDVWFATDDGLVRRRGDRFTKYTVADGLAHNGVRVLFEDRTGTLWIGTMRGLTRLRDGVFTSYTERDGFVGNHVRAIHEDADGVMWIGTYDGGLYRAASGRLTRYTTRDGLHDNGVFQILEDDDGNLWMGSNRGIFRVSRRELNEFAAGGRRSVRSTVFGLRDGLATLECNGGRQPSGLRTDDGRLWLPTQGGVAVVDPKAVRINTHEPPVVIESVHLQGDPVEFRGGVDAGAHQNSFEIRYTAMSFVKPDGVRFQYRLAGLDDTWIDAGDRRTAAFYRIPPGRYEFQVVAANSDGVWSRTGDRVSIVVRAPIWRRGWFLSLVVVVLAGLAVRVERMRTARQRAEHARQKAYARQLLEAQENERRRISTDLHDSLGQSLLLIRSQARSASAAGDGFARTFDAISDLAGKAHADMKEIAYNLRPYQLDKIGVSRTIDGMVRRIDGTGGIQFDADIADIDDLVPAQAAISIYRIVQEGVTNIVRHSAATRAGVTIRRQAGSVEIEIADNGRGFQAPSASSHHLSTPGFGLMGIEERARSLNGEVTVRTNPGRGTTVVVRFPHGEARQ